MVSAYIDVVLYFGFSLKFDLAIVRHGPSPCDKFRLAFKSHSDVTGMARFTSLAFYVFACNIRCTHAVIFNRPAVELLVDNIDAYDGVILPSPYEYDFTTVDVCERLSHICMFVFRNVLNCLSSRGCAGIQCFLIKPHAAQSHVWEFNLSCRSCVCN